MPESPHRVEAGCPCVVAIGNHGVMGSGNRSVGCTKLERGHVDVVHLVALCWVNGAGYARIHEVARSSELVCDVET